ncbi:MAG: hypothetical protein H0T47_09605 [Planctomycetaceae bacterium]|nr:hypothetical protein [Planctomycetaceae bacterium]
MNGQPQKTLRDEFAAQALQAMIIKHPLLDLDGAFGEKVSQSRLNMHRQDLAEAAYEYANAMLVARVAIEPPPGVPSGGPWVTDREAGPDAAG